MFKRIYHINQKGKLHHRLDILVCDFFTFSDSSRPIKDPVSVEPGQFMYSIGGFTVAGAMLEVATNKTFEQLMTEVGKLKGLDCERSCTSRWV